MAMPPTTPIKTETDKISYFQYLATMAKPILSIEGITLDFTGYTETINDYKKLGTMDWKEAMRLSKEINAWSEYFSEIANLIQKAYLDIELRSNQKQALTSIKYDIEKVSNGNRLAFQDVEVINIYKQKHIIKSFFDELSSKVRFLERSYYHCKAIGDSGHKSAYILRENIIKQKSAVEDKEFPGYYKGKKNDDSLVEVVDSMLVNTESGEILEDNSEESKS